MRRLLAGSVLLLITFGCVDRLFFDIDSPGRYGISISGHVTNTGGPHRVNVFRNFDTESKDSLKTGVSAKSVIISDAEGNSVELSQIKSGIYETQAGELVGKAGSVYKVSVELDDGRAYESVPDTLPVGGVIDSAYYKFVGQPVVDGYVYNYEIHTNSSTDADLRKTWFVWSNKTTYKSTTKPELEYLVNPPCYRQAENQGRCNFVAPCSGLKNVGTNYEIALEFEGPCECCTCWYDQYSTAIVLSDIYGSANGRFRDIIVDRVQQTAGT